MIYQMFFGRPYLDEWKDENGVVENSDAAIAKRLALDTAEVGLFLNIATTERFALLDSLRDSGISEEEITERIRAYDENILRHLYD